MTLLYPSIFLSLFFLAEADRVPAPPFFDAEGTPLSVEIGVYDSGVMQDVKHVWGPDPRYVTVGVGGGGTSVGGGGGGPLALQEFASRPLPKLGIVGMPDASDRASVGANSQAAQKGNAALVPAKLPSQILGEARPSILDRPGITRLDPP